MIELRNKIKGLQEQQELALISFIMAALPEQKLCLDCIKAIEQGGGDVLELGVPFSDPLADGAVIEKLHHQGIAMGLNLRRSLDFVDQVRQFSKLPLVLFSYFNPIYQMGMAEFTQECQAVGIQAVIIPDLSLDELQLRSHPDLELIPMVAPSSSDERLNLLAGMQPSFIYCVSVRGVTGVRSLPEEEIKDYLARVRERTEAPLALGFGISSPDQIKTFRNCADGVVVGSHLAQIIEEYGSKPHLLPPRIESTIAGLKKACTG